MKNLVFQPFLRTNLYPHIIFLSVIALLLFYHSAGNLIRYFDSTASLLDGGIWQLILLSLICFLGFTILSWHLLSTAWMRLGLTSLNQIILQFNDLHTWQQLGFYWASFALLLLAGVGTLAALL